MILVATSPKTEWYCAWAIWEHGGRYYEIIWVDHSDVLFWQIGGTYTACRQIPGHNLGQLIATGSIHGTRQDWERFLVTPEALFAEMIL